MLTKIRLDGVMGRKFGKEWNLEVSSPAEALRMIEANKPGLKRWIVENKETYDAYRVTCVYENEREEDLSDETYMLMRGGLKEIRFSPTTTGASAVAKIIVGVVMIAVGWAFPGPWTPYLYKIGAALILSGIVEALSPRPNTKNEEDKTSSNYFDGPANTETQGTPVPLIYGRVMTGSHPVSASISIDEVAVG